MKTTIPLTLPLPYPTCNLSPKSSQSQPSVPFGVVGDLLVVGQEPQGVNDALGSSSSVPNELDLAVEHLHGHEVALQEVGEKSCHYNVLLNYVLCYFGVECRWLQWMQVFGEGVAWRILFGVLVLIFFYMLLF